MVLCVSLASRHDDLPQDLPHKLASFFCSLELKSKSITIVSLCSGADLCGIYEAESPVPGS